MVLAIILGAAVLVAAALIATRLERRSKVRRLEDAALRQRLARAEKSLRRIASHTTADPALDASIALETNDQETP